MSMKAMLEAMMVAARIQGSPVRSDDPWRGPRFGVICGLPPSRSWRASYPKLRAIAKRMSASPDLVSALRLFPTWVDPDRHIQSRERRPPANHGARPLGNGDGGGIGVAADDGRHDGSIDDAKTLQSLKAQFAIHHRHGVGGETHLAGSDRMVAGLQRLADPGVDGILALYRMARIDLLAAIRIERLLGQDLAQQPDAGAQIGAILRIRHIVE